MARAIDYELYHWGIKKGEEKKDHKYISREWVKGKWQYTYKSDSKKSQKTEASDASDKKLSIGSNNTKTKLSTSIFKYSANKVKQATTNTISSVKNKVSSANSSIRSSLKSLPNAVTSKTKETREKISKNIENGTKILGNIRSRTLSDEDKREYAQKAGKYIAKAVSGILGSTAYKAVINNCHATSFESFKKKIFNKDSSRKSKDADQEAVNPYYETGLDDYGYSNNCAYCTAAYDLRRRGYDVEAMPADPVTYDANLYTIPSWYENTTADDWEYANVDASVYMSYYNRGDYSTCDQLIRNNHQLMGNYLAKAMPDGSYGQYCVFWTCGGGHSMVWEKDNGVVYIRDCQSNTKYTFDEWANSDLAGYAYESYVLRTDNREPSDEILKTVRNK